MGEKVPDQPELPRDVLRATDTTAEAFARAEADLVALKQDVAYESKRHLFPPHHTPPLFQEDQG